MDKHDQYIRNAKLLKEYKSGDITAREELIIENSRIVMKIAQRFTFNYRFDFDDLCQEGYIGIIKAIEKFDPAFNIPFVNYAAFWIKQCIIRYIYDKGHIIKIPVAVRNKILLLKKAKNYLWSEVGREPSSFDLSKYLRISLYEVERLIQLNEDALSIDQPIGDNEDEFTLISIIKDESETPEEYAEKNDTVYKVKKAISKLKGTYKEIICSRYGIERKPEKQNETCNRLNISASTFRSCEIHALSILKGMPEIKGLIIEKRLDDLTNFYNETEKVVIWREERRRYAYNEYLDKSYQKNFKIISTRI